MQTSWVKSFMHTWGAREGGRTLRKDVFLPSRHLLSAFYKTLPSKNLVFTENPLQAPSKNPSEKHLLLENLLRTLLRVACCCMTPLVCTLALQSLKTLDDPNVRMSITHGGAKNFGQKSFGLLKIFCSLPRGPARHLNASRQKLTPHCLAAIFDSQ